MLRAEGSIEIASSEAGAFALNPSGGLGLVGRQSGFAIEAGEEPGVEPAATSATITVTADGVYFRTGNALDISNAAAEPSTAIFGVIVPTPDGA